MWKKATLGIIVLIGLAQNFRRQEQNGNSIRIVNLARQNIASCGAVKSAAVVTLRSSAPGRARPCT